MRHAKGLRYYTDIYKVKVMSCSFFISSCKSVAKRAGGNNRLVIFVEVYHQGRGGKRKNEGER